MNPKDLLSLLDLDGSASAAPPDGPLIVTSALTQPPSEPSPTALAMDEWGLRRGRDLIAESERLAKSGTDEFGAADFFTAAFDSDPQLLDACHDTLRRAFLAQLLDTPECQSLRISTQLDDLASSIAAAHFAEQFAQLQKEDAHTHPADEMGREMAALRAAGRAAAEASDEIGELHDAKSALGMGAGMPGSNDPKAIAALFQRVRSDPSLRQICELAGRFRRVAQSKQRLKTAHGLDDVVGVEPGGDVSRLLPVELVKLMVPELELDTLRRIAERQALCREYHAVEPVGKGPIIVSVDESGSMEGEKANTAKALALALAWIARQQRRWCGLIAYSGESGERLLTLPPSRWDESALCDWLADFIGCGSNLDVPVREMPDYYRRLGAPAGITDIVFITDAQCRIDTNTQHRFRAWKSEIRARLITLVLDNPPGDLAAISDEVHQVRSLAPDDEAVGRVLSL